MSKRMFLLILFPLVAGGIFWFVARRTGPRATMIVLITPDTLRRDHVGAYGVGEFTPHLDAWAKTSAVRFDDARSPVPLTLPAHVTMLSGLPPRRTGVHTNAERVPSKDERAFALLPEVLSEEGWHTAGFVSASVMGHSTGLGAVFDHYDDGELRDRGTLTVPERPHPETVSRAVAYVRSRARDEKLFVWVHLFEPHAPYSENGRYDGGVRAVDEGIRALLKGLREIRGDDVCVLVAADHGEALEDLGESSHGVLLGDAVLRVPFFLSAPGMAAAVRSDPAELADVAPTLAEAAGLDWPEASGPGVGRSLWEPGPPRPSIAESLEGHRRYRWAQMIGASDEAGTLVDVGEGRFHWFPRAEPGQGQSGPLPPPSDERVQVLADFIAKYKQSPVGRASAGSAPRYYGTGPTSSELLDPAENARLPDPYQVIGRASVLAGVSQVIRAEMQTPRRLEAAIKQLRQMASVDPGNPEIAFWLGMAWERAVRRFGEIDRSPKEMAHAAQEAAKAYRLAFELGREDPTTVWKAVGVDSSVPPEELLRLLNQLVKKLPAPDCRVLLLKARLLQAIPGREAEARAVCEQARALCERDEKRVVWGKTCASD